MRRHKCICNGVVLIWFTTGVSDRGCHKPKPYKLRITKADGTLFIHTLPYSYGSEKSRVLAQKLASGAAELDTCTVEAGDKIVVDD